MLLVETAGQSRFVARCCARSAAAGVRAGGMTLSHARALLPSDAVRVEPFAPERDDAALRALAAWATRFSPVVAPDAPDGLLLDIAGCARLFRSERRLAGNLLGAVRRMGFDARAAIAPTFACAWGVARHGAEDLAVVQEGGACDAIAPLPIGALNVDGDTGAALADLGVTRVGELMRLPRSALPSRFGPALLLRLDRALGQAMETIDPVRPREPARASIDFDGPTTRAESLEAAAREALTRLVAALERRGAGLCRLDVELARPSDTPVLIAVTLSRATRSARHLWSLLRPKLERANLGFGVEAVRLTASRTRRIAHAQDACWRDQPASVQTESDAAFGELADTLANRLGPERVARAFVVESHLPERAFRLEPVSAAPRRARIARLADAPRPMVLLDDPEPARVIALTPDGPVSRLRWRGREHAIAVTVGPERIAPEWWREAAGHPHATRDYFSLQDESGRWLWVFREPGTTRWFVHGEWA